MKRAADDFEEIKKRLKIIKINAEGRCMLREGGATVDCWCYMAGPNGISLPCPPNPNAPDASTNQPMQEDSYCDG